MQVNTYNHILVYIQEIILACMLHTHLYCIHVLYHPSFHHHNLVDHFLNRNAQLNNKSNRSWIKKILHTVSPSSAPSAITSFLLRRRALCIHRYDVTKQLHENT